LVYRPLIIQFKLGEITGTPGSEILDNHPSVKSGNLVTLIPNNTSKRYFIVDRIYDSEALPRHHAQKAPKRARENFLGQFS
jgi:hypothetical protein